MDGDYKRMAFVKQPNMWSCLPTSFANMLGYDPIRFIREIGHDGSEIVNDKAEPYCRRSFHPEECIRAALRLAGAYICTYEAYPMFDDTEIKLDIKEFYEIISKFNRGTLTTFYYGKGHAFTLYNRCEDVFDPSNGTTCTLESLIKLSGYQPYMFYGNIISI